MNEYSILLEELDKIISKWQQRLNYQSNQGKDIHDCFLCSTVMYEIERAKQKANIRIAELNEKALRNFSEENKKQSSLEEKLKEKFKDLDGQLKLE